MRLAYTGPTFIAAKKFYFKKINVKFTFCFPKAVEIK